jgi:hypothetical protein
VNDFWSNFNRKIANTAPADVVKNFSNFFSLLNCYNKKNKKTQKKFEKKIYPHPHLPLVLPLIFHETTSNSFQLLQTSSKINDQNFMPIGNSLAEKMRDMTLQTTDYRHDQYISRLFLSGRYKQQERFSTS